MTTKQRIAKRQAINQHLGAIDAKRRCTYCRAAFTGVIWESMLARGRFCSEACHQAAEELEHLKAKR